MPSLLSSTTAETCHCPDIADVDDAKFPDCAETFMTLLQVINEWYCTRPCHTKTQWLQFLSLQLLKVMKEDISDPVVMK